MDERYLNDLKMHLSPQPSCLSCCPFWGGDSLVVDLLFKCTFHYGVLCLSLFWYALLCALPTFAIILKRKRELVALLLLSYGYLVTVNVQWLFLMM